MHGPRKVVLDEFGIVLDVSPFKGEADFFCLSPGLVDLQMNGFEDVDVASANSDEFFRLDTQLSRLGTTSWLGTVVTAPFHQLDRVVARLQQFHDDKNIRGFLGVHLEGPFLGGAPGAHRVKDIVPVDTTWVSELPSVVRMMTIAPEQENAIAGISQLKAQEIVISLGHCQPSNQQYDDAVAAGVSMVTHLFNAMSGVHHRNFGVALRALTDDRMSVGLIADLVHVQPDAVNLAFRAKGGDQICLVSDTVGWSSSAMRNLGVEATDAVRLANGTLAGSCTPLAACVRNVVRTCGVSLEHALRAATSSPADAIGSPTIGRIGVGFACDLIAWDVSLTVVDTWRRLPSVGA